jgi:hypothetical protein
MMVPEEKTELPKESVEQAPAPSPETVVDVEKLVLHETGREKTEERYNEILSKVSPQKTASLSDDDAVVLDAKHIGALTDEESKVQKLLDLAGVKGVTHAVKVTRSLKDYYALDRMHDELADKLYQGLLEKGLIEKE